MSLTYPGTEQIKEDLLDEYMSEHDLGKLEEVYRKSPSGRTVIENVSYGMQRSSHLAPMVKELEKKYENFDELAPAYLSTGDDESYQDCLNSLSCSKRINYLLFTNQAQGFGIDKRTQFSERFRKNEPQIKEVLIGVYNRKKELVKLMNDGFVDYTRVQPRLEKYLAEIGTMLNLQKLIYESELALGGLFTAYMDKQVFPEWEAKKRDNDRGFRNSMTQLTSALTKRGLDSPKIRDKMNKALVLKVVSEMKEHNSFVRGEVEVLEDILKYLSAIIKHMPKPDGDK